MKNQDIVGEALAAVLPQYNKPWFKVPHLLKLNLILIVPLLSSAVAGYDGSLMNGLQSLREWQEYFNHPTGSILGIVNAAQSIGSVISLPFVGMLSDKIGRRLTLLMGAVTIIIASAIQAASVQYGMFVFSRVLVGIGSMLVVQPAPMLITELAYPTHRGKYTSAFWTMYYLGAILASWTTYGTQTNIAGDWTWRIPSIVQAGFPIVQLAFWWCVPESPRWLIANDRKEEAEKLLACFHTAGNGSHPLIQFEMAEITYGLSIEAHASQTPWSALIKTPGNRHRTLIAVCVGAFAQWNVSLSSYPSSSDLFNQVGQGVAVVSYYLTLVLNTVGIEDPSTQTMINGLLQVFNFIASGCAAMLVDRLGRRTLFIWSAAGMLASFVIWTICSARFDQSGNAALGHTVIAFVFIFYFHYDVAYCPLLMGYPTEIFPYAVRSKGVSMVLMSVYSSLVILAFVNPIALENIGWHYYIFFCCFDVIVLIVTLLLFPETKGHSLEDIAAIFDGPASSTAVLELGKKDTGIAQEHMEYAG